MVAYHLGYLPGGWIGVDLFFVLSGFLITSLLLADGFGRGRVALGAFWARRARRLLPAVLLLLAVVGAYSWLGGPGIVAAQLRAPALSTLLYGANWQQIVAGHSYFAQFSSPDPLQHTWSLAIEEQYYLLWPPVVALAFLLARRRGRRPGHGLLLLGGALASGSALWMGWAAHLFGANRAYLGTDTRAWELLIGATAAIWLNRPGRVPGARQRFWRWAPVPAALAVAAAVSQAGGPPSWAWYGGLVGTGLAALVVVVGLTLAPAGPLARLLSLGPLRWLGRVSYSLYLWHWPVVVLVTETTTGISGVALLGVRLGLMVTATCVSYYLVERPLRAADWSGWLRRATIPVGLAGTTAVVLLGTALPAAAGTAGLSDASHAAGPARALHLYLPPGRVPSPTDPLRVWILGDSVMQDSSPGVTAALEATGEVKVVANSSFGGWGLTTDKYWPGDGLQIVHQYHPEVVMGTWSWDNPLAQSHPRAYEAELQSTLGMLLARGTGVDDVVLFQFPVTGPYPLYPTQAQKQAAWISTLVGERAWDRAAAAAASAFPGRAAYVPTSQLFAPGGRFLVWMKTPSGTWLRARKVDDIHMCPYGAAEFGNLVLARLGPALQLGAARSGWQSGPWIHDRRYNTPPGSCPDDHPVGHYGGTPLPKLPPISQRAPSRSPARGVAPNASGR